VAIMAVRDGRPDTWLVEPIPPCDSENEHGLHTDFSARERSSANNSELRSQLKCEGVSGGVKGRDERQNGALDPATQTSAALCLDKGPTSSYTRGEFCGFRVSSGHTEVSPSDHSRNLRLGGTITCTQARIIPRNLCTLIPQMKVRF